MQQAISETSAATYSIIEVNCNGWAMDGRSNFILAILLELL